MAEVTPLVPASADPDVFLLRSGVRSGLKRELAFALKAQAEMLVSPVGRTRSGKILRSPAPRKSAGAKRARVMKGAESHEEIPVCAPLDGAVQRNVEAPAGNVIGVDVGNERMVVGASDAVPLEALVVEEPIAEAPERNQIDSASANLTLSVIGTEDRVKEEAARISQTEEVSLVQIPAELCSQVPQLVEEKAVLENSTNRFKRSSPKAATVENGAPEKPMRRFTRSLLKTTLDEAPLSTAEKPLVEAEGPLATTAESNGFKEAKDADDTAHEAEEQPRTTPKKKMELKMSKKISLTKIPSNIKDLLATGLLEGQTVKYITRSYDKQGLHGVIQDGNILCFCASCKGSKTVSAYYFELHAGSTKKHPSENIYLENGSSLRDVIRVCAAAPLDMLESTIQGAISLVRPTPSCGKCKVYHDKSHIGKLTSVCESCLIAKLSPETPKFTRGINDNLRSSKAIAVSDSSDSGLRSMSSQKKNSRGKMTTKDLRLHKLVFMDGILPDGTEVAYYACGKKLLEGYIKGTGIFCHCCSMVVSPSQFEAHAGWASRRKPYLNIYTSNGVSLHELSVSLSKDKIFSASENDDLCRVCADGGNLLLCDLCPRAFHKECIGLTTIPRGDWYCPFCKHMHQKEKFVEHNKNAIAAGRVAGVDPIAEIYQKCIRVVKLLESDIGGCALCRGHDFCKNEFGPLTVMLCDQCEREFHVGCLKDHNMADLKELPVGEWFCSSDCTRIHNVLQKLLASGAEQVPEIQLDKLRRKYAEKGIDPPKLVDTDTAFDVRWRVVSGKTASPETGPLLSQTVSLFRECFDPIVDAVTRVDLIPELVYGRDSRDQEFGGMFCAMLTINSCVVSAGILRVLGCEVAELPLVATSRESQGLGCFQLLFSCIEKMLDSMNVKHIVLPAADEAESIWVNKFGFSNVPMSELHDYTKGSRVMVFQGTSMLQKSVPKFPTEDTEKKKETG